MLKFEPITKKYINIHYSVLYLPEEQYSEKMIAKDEEYINTIINNATDSRFSTFSRVVEELVWNTIDNLMAK